MLGGMFTLIKERHAGHELCWSNKRPVAPASWDPVLLKALPCLQTSCSLREVTYIPWLCLSQERPAAERLLIAMQLKGNSF